DREQVWRLSRNTQMRTLKIGPSIIKPILAAERGEHAEWGYDAVVDGASSIPRAALEVAIERFGPTLVQDYGQAEAPVTITSLRKADQLDPEARLSAGRPWRSVAVEVRDENEVQAPPGEMGEVYVHGKHMMSGYHNKPDETAEV